jgi:hypothetical protein
MKGDKSKRRHPVLDLSRSKEPIPTDRIKRKKRRRRAR